VGLDFGFGLFSGIKNSITAIVVMELFIPRKERRTSPKDGSRFLLSSLQKNKWKSHVFERKEKKCLEERNGGCDRRGGKSSSFMVKKARISVQLQLHLDS